MKSLLSVSVVSVSPDCVKLPLEIALKELSSVKITENDNFHNFLLRPKHHQLHFFRMNNHRLSREFINKSLSLMSVSSSVEERSKKKENELK